MDGTIEHGKWGIAKNSVFGKMNYLHGGETEREGEHVCV